MAAKPHLTLGAIAESIIPTDLCIIWAFCGAGKGVVARLLAATCMVHEAIRPKSLLLGAIGEIIHIISAGRHWGVLSINNVY